MSKKIGFSGVHWLRATTALCVSLGTPSVVAAQDAVTITMPAQNVEIVGELLSFDGQVYQLRTEQLGDINIRADGAICEGAACPTSDTASDVVEPAIAPAVADQTVRITGSFAMTHDLLPAVLTSLAEAQGGEVSGASFVEDTSQIIFQKQSDTGGTVDYTVNPLSPGLSFFELSSQDAALNMTYRPITEREVSRFGRKGMADLRTPSQQHIVGLDPMVLAVNPQNGVTSLTVEQLRNLFVGRYTNWSELGGASMPIVVISRESGVEARQISDQKIRGASASIQSIETVFVASSEGAATIIADNASAIGFVSRNALGTLSEVTIVDECNADIVADVFDIRSEDYPLSGRMYWYLREDAANDAEKALWDFVKTNPDQMEATVETAGLISNKIVMRSHQDDQARIAALNETAVQDGPEAALASVMLLQLAATTGRLSTTFRLIPDGDTFDDRATQDLDRLAQYILDQEKGVSEIVLAGFANEPDAARENLARSQAYSDDIRERLVDLLGDGAADVNIRAAGFGAVAPVVCPSSDVQSLTNNRVEVWVR